MRFMKTIIVVPLMMFERLAASIHAANITVTWSERDGNLRTADLGARLMLCYKI